MIQRRGLVLSAALLWCGACSSTTSTTVDQGGLATDGSGGTSDRGAVGDGGGGADRGPSGDGGGSADGLAPRDGNVTDKGASAEASNPKRDGGTGKDGASKDGASRDGATSCAYTQKEIDDAFRALAGSTLLKCLLVNGVDANNTFTAGKSYKVTVDAVKKSVTYDSDKGPVSHVWDCKTDSLVQNATKTSITLGEADQSGCNIDQTMGMYSGTVTTPQAKATWVFTY